MNAADKKEDDERTEPDDSAEPFNWDVKEPPRIDWTFDAETEPTKEPKL